MTRHLRSFAVGLGTVLPLSAALLVHWPGTTRIQKVYSSAGLINPDNYREAFGPSAQAGADALVSSLAGFGVSGLPIQAEGSRVFDVKVYGAKGDGVANDSPAFQSAYNAAVSGGGGIVYIPPSSSCYLLSTAINMTEDSHL